MTHPVWLTVGVLVAISLALHVLVELGADVGVF